MRQIVAIKRDVQNANGHLRTLDALDRRRNLLRQRLASAPNAHQNHVFNALVALDDLMRHARNAAQHLLVVHDQRLFLHVAIPRFRLVSF